MSAYVAKCRGFAASIMENPKKSMWFASVISGILLVIGGISGLINIFNPLEMVLSAYNMCATLACPASPARRSTGGTATDRTLLLLLRPVCLAFSSC